MAEVQRPVLLTVDEAAEWCGITRNTLSYLRMEGRFAPALKIGRRCYWTPEDLVAWIDAQREEVA
jgi:hypothetical protein